MNREKFDKKFRKTWEKIKERCFNVNSPIFCNYGGRGIKICNRWLKFSNFKDDMYLSYIKHIKSFGIKDTSIDRIDVNGDYEKSNCRWATVIEQQNNKRTVNNSIEMFQSTIALINKTRKLYLQGKSLREVGKILGIYRDTVKKILQPNYSESKGIPSKEEVMSMFRKKPVIVEAVQFKVPSIKPIKGVCYLKHKGTIKQSHIHTLEGIMLISNRDWIVRGIKGELYPVKPNIFKRTYEPAL